ncbi:hypothetical protein [uncultured Thiodictyon sp.]|uniref:hypothetical protein n=1 Tax=uncultured Thiodictyon sp. TaxID=1846217 RepID=UPI0025EDB8BC|nr:hypothetical protein [uncultured Thiodictyon sp.]
MSDQPTSCDCIDQVDVDLAKRGVRLITTTPMKGLALLEQRVTLAVERTDSRSRRPLPSVHGTFCPICGRKYDNEVPQ